MKTMSGGPCLHYDCSNRNSFGYCKTTVCINSHYQQEQWELPSTTNKSESVVKKPQTNADRIRSMTDEELAELLRDTQCNTCAWQGNDCDYADECKAEKLEMLKQESDDNGT